MKSARPKTKLHDSISRPVQTHRSSASTLLARFGKAALALAVCLAPIMGFAWDPEGGEGWPDPDLESYLNRPDVLHLDRLGHNQAMIRKLIKEATHKASEKGRRAHLALAAELLELYPDHVIYFMGVGGGRHYDSARVIANGGKDLERIRLISVSLESSENQHFQQYLDQNGISERALLAGKKVLLVDTSETGLLVNRVTSLFNSKAAANIQAHSLANRNPNIPSSRVFMSYFSKVAHKQSHWSLRVSHEFDYQEHYQHYTAPAIGYIGYMGRWHPVSYVQKQWGYRTGALDGTFMGDGISYSKEAEIGDMYALRDYWETPEAKESVVQTRSLVKHIRTLLLQGRVGELKALIQDKTKEASFAEAVVRDALAALPTIGLAPRVSLADLGLRNVLSPEEKVFERWAQKYPRWKNLIDDPVQEAYRLVKRLRPDEIREFQNMRFPGQIRRWVIVELFEHNDPRLESVQLDFIDKADGEDMFWLRSSTRGMLERGMTRQIERLIEKFPASELGEFALDLFRNYQLRYGHPALIIKVILHADANGLEEMRTRFTKKGFSGFSLVEDIPLVGGILNRSLSILDPEKRADFLRTELAGVDASLARQIPAPKGGVASPGESSGPSSGPRTCESVFSYPK